LIGDKDMLFEMHVHTSESSPCASISGTDVASVYKKAGYDGVVITDHLTSLLFSTSGLDWKKYCQAHTEGYKKAKAKGDKIGLKVLYGCELRFDVTGANDYLVYGMSNKFLVDNPDIFKWSIHHFKSVAEKNGFVFYQAHPFRNNMITVPHEYLFGMEVFNGTKEQVYDVLNTQNNDVASHVADKYSLHKIAGSDCHHFDGAARAGLRFNCKIKDNKTLVEALLNDKYMLLVGSEC